MKDLTNSLEEEFDILSRRIDECTFAKKRMEDLLSEWAISCREESKKFEDKIRKHFSVIRLEMTLLGRGGYDLYWHPLLQNERISVNHTDVLEFKGNTSIIELSFLFIHVSSERLVYVTHSGDRVPLRLIHSLRHFGENQ